MIQFSALFTLNFKRRIMDGFALGYNIIFPILLIWLLGFLFKGKSFGPIRGYQYYSVVFIPFSIVLSIVTAAYAGKDDAYAKTAQRILASPVSVFSLVLAKILAETLIFTGCAILVYVVAGCFWNRTMLQSVIGCLALYLSLSYVSAGVGTYLGLSTKNFLVVKNFVSVPVCLAAVLGGTFFQTILHGRLILFFMNLSPFTWINRGLFMMLYDQKNNLVFITIVVNLLVGSLFMILTFLCFKKEEYGNGELPGYEK